MTFNKAKTLKNLKRLELSIQDFYAVCIQARNEDLTGKAHNDIMFVRGLMDDIECNRITEFPLVEKTNFMSGKTFLEEADRPYYCSPSSETFWSM